MPERDILEELANATEENPLIIDRPLNTKEQVIAFNENVFGTIANMHEDYKYPFSIEDVLLKKIEKEKGQWWGTIEQVARASMTNCIDLGYIPWKLTYVTEMNGIHHFIISCEDRRIQTREGNTDCTGLGQP